VPHRTHALSCQELPGPICQGDCSWTPEAPDIGYTAQKCRHFVVQLPKSGRTFGADAGPDDVEVDFLVDTGRGVVPVEVEAERNRQSKSLRVYIDRYTPPRSVRTALAPFTSENGLIDLPLYAIGMVSDLLRDSSTGF